VAGAGAGAAAACGGGLELGAAAGGLLVATCDVGSDVVCGVDCAVDAGSTVFELVAFPSVDEELPEVTGTELSTL
jgi:hypothetical protein